MSDYDFFKNNPLLPKYEPPKFEPIKFEPINPIKFELINPIKLEPINPIKFEPINPMKYEPPKPPQTTFCGQPGCTGHAGFGSCPPRPGPGLRLGPPGNPMTW
jgi:hypothetical protein